MKVKHLFKGFVNINTKFSKKKYRFLNEPNCYIKAW